MSTPAGMNRATWLLYLFHRWAGIVLCLILALWFFSGFFMMYVEFPQLSRMERLQGTPALNYSAVRLTPAEAATRLTADDFRIVGTPSMSAAMLSVPALNRVSCRRLIRRSWADVLVAQDSNPESERVSRSGHCRQIGRISGCRPLPFVQAGRTPTP